MPELPEVETTRLSLLLDTLGQRVSKVTIRQAQLRQRVSDELGSLIEGSTLLGIRRRAKYLLLDFEQGTLIVHLGMSGSLRSVPGTTPLRKHDHVDIALGEGRPILRYHDPRRFGLMVWGGRAPEAHPLLAHLGVEPLEPGFTPTWLYRASRDRKTALKVFLMDPAQVVGVGNIYASESLFRAGLSPLKAAGRLTRPAAERLCVAVRATLQEALDSGGSTLRDYVNGLGDPGAFQLKLRVYGRGGEPCLHCGAPIRQIRQAQRSTFYCPRCQR